MNNSRIIFAVTLSVFLLQSNSLVGQVLNVDVGDSNCNDDLGMPYCDIRRAVLDASSGDKIKLAPGNYTGTVVIDKHLEIIGEDAKNTFIEGGPFGRRAILIKSIPIDSLDVERTTVSISNVTIQNGRDVIDGGGILNTGNLTLSNCVITNNAADTSGGGIYSDLDLVIDNCIISNNRSQSISKINNTDIQGGGGIYSSGNLTLRNSQVIDNQSRDHGGGLYLTVYNYAKYSLIENTVFTNNSGYSVGAIYNNGSTTKIKNSAFDRNSGSGKDSVGGAISNTFVGELNIVNSTFSQNRATLRGGAIYHNSTGDTFLYNVTIANNSTGMASGRGGGIYRNSGGHVYLQNTLLSNNSANEDFGADCGGLIFSRGYNLISDANNCDIEINTEDQFGYESPIDAKLDVFADNGGSTKTHALIEGSPAINSGDVNGCRDSDENLLLVDQRGKPRPEADDIQCDIGAFEGVVAEKIDPVDSEQPTNKNVNEENTDDIASLKTSAGSLSILSLLFLFLMPVAVHKILMYRKVR